MKISKVVVIGSGTMGSGIAAQVANAGINVQLLDLTKEIASNACERIKKSRPPLLMEENNINLITPGSCLLYTSPSPRDRQKSRMPSSA